MTRPFLFCDNSTIGEVSEPYAADKPPAMIAGTRTLNCDNEGVAVGSQCRRAEGDRGPARALPRSTQSPKETQQTDILRGGCGFQPCETLRAGTSSFVIYGEPQSGKTEMMICLTAKLLDDGNRVIIHLLNDSVQLLQQNLDRFQRSNLSPAARNFSDVIDPEYSFATGFHVIFCKKNASDLAKLNQKLERVREKVVIDDEADFATPNALINKGDVTRILGLLSIL
ncbi:hypothetical protein [Bradyrhizobium sp. JR3.5]